MNSSSTETCEISATPSPSPATNGVVAGKTHPSEAVGVIVGAIGGVVGVLAIVLLLVFIFYHHHRHNEHKPVLISQNSKRGGMRFLFSCFSPPLSLISCDVEMVLKLVHGKIYHEF
jgi:uncharacterized integral membrane protein